jgi:hypothetical protein
MSDVVLRFDVTQLDATVPEGVPVTWRGRRFDSGPLTIALSSPGRSRGVLDYARRRARVEFHVRLHFPAFAETLHDLGVDPALAAPVEAVLISEGEILDDHSLALHGACDLSPHPLLPREATSAAVLPGQ